jgi:hypothetical protein
MQIDGYIETIRHQLEVTAEAGGDEAKALAERLVAPLESAIRLAVQDALADAAEEITLELAPGSVEVRLRGREPEFVVTLPPTDAAARDAELDDGFAGSWGSRRTADGAEGDDDAVARINLRLPERLKARVEDAAGDAGLSINAWLVRAAASAVDRDPTGRRERRPPTGAQRYQGWAK